MHCIRFCLLMLLLPAGGVISQEIIRTSAIAPDDPLLPDGFRIAAHLDCGNQTQSTQETGPRIAVISGEAYRFPGIEGPLAAAACSQERVVVAVSGMLPDTDYVLGFTWWDADKQGRVQSVRFHVGEDDGWRTVLPPVRACAYHKDKSTWARVLLPITEAYREGGRTQVAFVREAGPDAVVNEIWLLERTESSARRRVLVVTGDDYVGHHWRETAPHLADLIREDERLEVSITECPAIYGSPLLENYDATVIHFKDYSKRLPLGPDTWTGLERHIAGGRGLVITHFGCGAFQEWEGFVKIAGRVWNPAMRPHDPHGRFEVRIADAAHAITHGMATFTVEDELYTCLDGETPVRTLCEATSVVDRQVYPIAFVVEGLPGRVFHGTLGHDVRAFSAPGTHAMYRRATAWAAGLEPAP